MLLTRIIYVRYNIPTISGETVTITASEVIKIIEADGWFHIKTEGSHQHYKHPTKPGKVSVPQHGKRNLHPKTLKSILRQAGLA